MITRNLRKSVPYYYLERSQCKYNGEDRLTPKHSNFMSSESWASERIQKFNLRLKRPYHNEKDIA